MGLLDNVDDHPDKRPTALDWTKIKDGLKWKSIVLDKRDDYANRIGVDPATISTDTYVFQLLFDSIIEYEKSRSLADAHEAARDQLVAATESIREQLVSVKVELV